MLAILHDDPFHAGATRHPITRARDFCQSVCRRRGVVMFMVFDSCCVDYFVYVDIAVKEMRSGWGPRGFAESLLAAGSRRDHSALWRMECGLPDFHRERPQKGSACRTHALAHRRMLWYALTVTHHCPHRCPLQPPPLPSPSRRLPPLRPAIPVHACALCLVYCAGQSRVTSPRDHRHARRLSVCLRCSEY